MKNKIETVFANFSKTYKQGNSALIPNPGTLKDFEPILSKLRRDNLEIVNQLQEDGSLDGGDSAHRTGVIAFCNSKKDQGLLNVFEKEGKMVRHPQQIPWNNWKNCSRDQLFGYIAGCWRSQQLEIVERLYEQHKHRFPPFTCQNTEADYEGTTKFPPIGDPMGPHDIMYFKICKGEANAHQNLLGQFILQISIEISSKDITVEKNQLLLQSIVCGKLNSFVKVHSNYKEALKDYWSGWRKQPEIAEALIQVIEIELERYKDLPETELIIPLDLIDEFKNLSLLSLINELKDLKLDLLENEFLNGILKDVNSFSNKIISSFQGIINKRNTFIKNKLNELFPPLTVKEQQYKSITASQNILAVIKPQIGCFIHEEKVIESLLFQINNLLSNHNDANFIINKILPSISLGKQLIQLEFDFDITIPKFHLTIIGKIVGSSAISTEFDKLVLRQALTSFEISRLHFKEKTSFGDIEIIKDVSILIENYINNLNGKLFEKPTIIDLGWGETFELKLNQIANDTNAEIIGEDVKISRFTKNICLKIDRIGISAFIEISNIESTNLVSELKDEKNIDTSKNDIQFKKYTDSFNLIWSSLFEEIKNEDLVVVNLTKIELSNVLNEFLSKPILIKQNFEIPEFKFDEKIETKSSDIDCQNVRTEFSYPDFSYPDFSYPSFGGWDCMMDSGWPFYIKTEDPFCVANRETARAAHDVARETARAAHDVARETARIAKQTENEAKVAACNIGKEVTGFLAIGSFHGNLSAKGNGLVNFKSLKFDEELTNIELNFSGEINSTIKSNLNISPVDLGYVFLCFANYSKNITSEFKLQIPEKSNKINLATSKEGNNLNLIIKIDSIAFDASINPSPLHALLTDPSLYGICPSFIALIGLGAGVATSIAPFLAMVNKLPTLTPEQVLLLTGNAKGSYDIKEIIVPIIPIEFKINEGDQNEIKMQSQINWKTKSIQFITLKQ